MVKNKAKQLSKEEILESAASFIARTIDPEKTKLDINDKSCDVFLEKFKKAFKEQAEEMLKKKPALILAIGPYVNTDNNGIYSKDMEEILNHIENVVQQKCFFIYGAIALVGETEFYSCWQRH